MGSRCYSTPAHYLLDRALYEVCVDCGELGCALEVDEEAEWPVVGRRKVESKGCRRSRRKETVEEHENGAEETEDVEETMLIEPDMPGEPIHCLKGELVEDTPDTKCDAGAEGSSFGKDEDSQARINQISGQVDNYIEDEVSGRHAIEEEKVSENQSAFESEAQEDPQRNDDKSSPISESVECDDEGLCLEEEVSDASKSRSSAESPSHLSKKSEALSSDRSEASVRQRQQGVFDCFEDVCARLSESLP